MCTRLSIPVSVDPGRSGKEARLEDGQFMFMSKGNGRHVIFRINVGSLGLEVGGFPLPLWDPMLNNVL